MNLEHLRAFIWLRWRLRANQQKRLGSGARVLQTILAVLAVIGTVVAFFGGFALGFWALPQVSSLILMLVWDGLLAAFVFIWMLELLTELQRSELLSLDKFLHLPVSVSGAFLINYLATIFSPSMILFLPLIVGLSLGLVLSRGPMMLLLFPTAAAFVLTVTAITYQFRGWLAALMANKRKRRTVIAVATVGFVLIFQIPNVLNVTGVMRFGRRSGREVRQETRTQEVDRVATSANLAIPLGWLPYAARAAADGRALPPLLATVGLGLIGAVSLGRSYRTTLRIYTGTVAAQKTASSVQPRRPSRFLEMKLPWLSEQTAAIALAGFRSLTRAPEAKMMLFSPVILIAVFGSMFVRQASNASEFLMPVMASAANAMVLFTMTQLAGNQFAFDRSRFRAFVLCPASRKDILLGKNLAMLPLALILSTVTLVVMQFARPMAIDHFVAALFQIITLSLIYFLVANLVSIFAPMPIASGSLKPVSPKGITILIHAGFLLLMPIAMSVALLPLGVEFLLLWLGRLSFAPVYLLLTLAELLLVVYLYPFILEAQGRLLHSREQKILEVVISKAE